MMFWRVIVWLVGMGVALRIADTLDRRRQAHAGRAGRRCTDGGGKPCEPMGPSTPPSAMEAVLSALPSEILASADAPALITTAPRPRHPRPIEGEEIRVRPPLPLRSPVEVMLHMALARPAYERRAMPGRPS